jgi:ribonuclease D
MDPQSKESLVDKDYVYIDDDESLNRFINEIEGSGYTHCAIDTEADSLHCYEEKLCLIQFAVKDRFAIIDPLSIGDLSSLIDFINRTEVWLHGADFDMRMLKRTYGSVPEVVYDTQTASRLLGVKKFGLVNLVENHFGVVLPKTSQKADWGKRPLSEKMLEYAVNDVRYLLKMADTLTSRLKELERWDWFVESCESAKELASVIKEKDEDLAWRISGWGKLDQEGMAFLRALWFWRDGEAARRNRPAFKIIGNQDLLRFSQDLQKGIEVKLPSRFPSQPVKRFKKAIESVRELMPADFPERPKRVKGKRDPTAEKKFDKLKILRDRVSEELDIDPTLIASRATLERVAASPQEADEILLNWQKNLLIEVIDVIQ